MSAKLPTTNAVSLPGAYWQQWSASLISNLGDGVNFVAMPLLALRLTTDTRLIALTTAMTYAPWLLLALPVGAGVDRLNRKTIMALADFARFGLFGVIALLARSGTLSIWLLLLLLVGIGIGEVCFDSTSQAFLPQLVQPELLARANGYLMAAEVAAGSIAGLALGAFLFDISPGTPFGVNAVTFLVAAVIIARIRPRRVAATVPATPLLNDEFTGHGWLVGLRWLWGHNLLRRLAILFMLTNFGLMLSQGTFVKYAIETLGLNALQYGVLLAVTALGAVVGGLLGGRIVDRIGQVWAVMVPYVVFGVGNIVIWATGTAVIVAITGFMLGFAITVWNVATISWRQLLIPAELFGRVNAVYRWLGTAASASGVIAGGGIAFWFGLPMPFLLGGLIVLASIAIFGRSIWRGFTLPTVEAQPAGSYL